MAIPPERTGQVAPLRARQAGHRLVQKQQVGLQRQGAGDLDQPLSAEGQVDGEPVGVGPQPEEIQQLAR
jgi:hypothetical protein